ncbi:hypothetical protein QUF75_07225 [Desulfococcaceae bacterium HSG7]|nr:hypothetical protein [Desulfococcaceae bacterium HSG7]
MQSLKTELQAVSAALNSLAENVEVLVKALDNPDDKKNTTDKQAIEKQPEQTDQIKPKETKSAPPKKASAKRKVAQADQVEPEETESAPSKKVRPKKASVKRKAVPRSKRPQTDTDKVVAIIKRAKRGVNIAELRRKTQFNSKKISNIVHRASRANRIKKIDRGIYSIVEG